MAAEWKQSVLITGCSPGGIGHQLALEFHRRGCHVIATARNPAVLKDLGAIGMSTVALDVTSTDSIAACKAQVATLTNGKLDILVNNAGRTHTVPATDIELDDVRATYEANVFGPMAMVQAFVPMLREARGLVLNVSSISSEMPYLFAPVYASSKGALNSYSRVLRMELKPFNIRVMVVMAGTVRSNIASHVERVLPTDSLYLPVQDMYQKRLTFSQNNATMPTEMFASGVVNQALKGEGWFGGLIGGTPEWFYIGGMATLASVLNWLPRSWTERSVAIFFQMGLMAKRLRDARAKKD